MSVYHDEVEIEDFEYDEDSETYFYPCPCGDRFEISKVRCQIFNDVEQYDVIGQNLLFRNNWKMVKKRLHAQAVLSLLR